MENGSIRLLISFILTISVWVFTSLLPETIGQILIVLIGLWFVIESVAFSIRNWNNPEYNALIFIIWLLTLQILLFIIIIVSDWIIDVSPDILQGFILWFVFSAVVFLILGIWAIIKGIKLIRNKSNIKMGIANLIIGIIVALPMLLLLGSLVLSLIAGPGPPAPAVK